MEQWNDAILVFEKDMYHYNFIVTPACIGTINPTLHHPKTHYSSIPTFHHSNVEQSELSSKLLKLDDYKSKDK